MNELRSLLTIHARLKWFKGTLVVFCVLILAGCGQLPAQGQLPDMAVLFAREAHNARETLQVASYSARGKRQGPRIYLGLLGLVAQTQIMASHKGTLWITTGYALKQITPSHSVRTVWSAPNHSTILSVDYIHNHLWAIVEPLGGRFVDIYCEQQGHFIDRIRGPLAITTLYPAYGGVGVLRVWPNQAQLELWPFHGNPRQWTLHGVPQGTMALTKTTGYLPMSTGLNRFGIATVSLKGAMSGSRIHFFHNVDDAVLQAIASNPPYGVTVQGIMPLSAGAKSPPILRKWPQALSTTITTAMKSPTSWLIILDGPSQGLWFNPRLDRFGPTFQVTAPKGDFPRAVLPWNS